MNKKQHSLLFILGLCIFLVLFLMVEKLSISIDMTENALYSLSDYSRELHKNIPDKIQIRYYVSDQLKNMYPEPDEITNFLSEYALQSGGKIQFSVIDPAKSGESEKVKEAGISEQQIQSSSQTRTTLVSVYSGILIEYLDSVSVIPFVFSVERLEYIISSRIQALLRNTPIKVGIIAAAADTSWDQDYVYLQELLQAHDYQIQLLSREEAVPDSIAVLMIFDGVEQLEQQSLLFIDRFIQAGGSVFFALEAVHVDTLGTLLAREKKDKGLLAMLAHYGVRVDPVLVLDTVSLSVPYTTTDSSGTSITEGRTYPHWIRIAADTATVQHPLLHHFGGLDLFWASPLMPDPPETVKTTVLAKSSNASWLMLEPFITDPADADLFNRDANRTRGSYPVAVALNGSFPSWTKKTGTTADQSKDARVLVVGDSDIATTFIQYTESERNLDFMLSALDWLAYNDGLLGIEKKSDTAAHLDAISDETKRIRVVLFSQILTVLFIPLFLILTGIFWISKRKKQRI